MSLAGIIVLAIEKNRIGGFMDNGKVITYCSHINVLVRSIQQKRITTTRSHTVVPIPINQLLLGCRAGLYQVTTRRLAWDLAILGRGCRSNNPRRGAFFGRLFQLGSQEGLTYADHKPLVPNPVGVECLVDVSVCLQKASKLAAG